jgi:RNA polymerase sigma factor (sigma-70 family)
MSHSTEPTRARSDGGLPFARETSQPPAPVGPAAQFVDLWEMAREDLYAQCLALMGGNRLEAEEAFGSASVVALVQYQKLGEELREPRAWLSRLFRNVCMDLHRKRRRQRELGVANLEALEGAQAPLASAAWKTPQESYLDRELDTFVRQSVRDLPERLHRPIVLRFFRQLSYQEIGQHLRISEENARKRVQQARVALRERLVRYFEGRPGLVGKILEPQAVLDVGPPVATASPFSEGGEELGAGAAALCPIEVRLLSGAVRDVVLFLPGEARRQPRRPEARLEALSRYVEKHPGGWKKRREVAEVLYLAGRWEEALAEYQFVLAKQPFLYEGWLRIGAVLAGLGRETEAVDAYQRALLLARRQGSRQHLHGKISLCQGRLGAALDDFAAAAALEAANPAHWNALGEAHLEADHPLEAVAAFDRALGLDRGDLRALTLGHEALLAAGQGREAFRRACRALELTPTDCVAAKRLTDLRCRRGLVSGSEGNQTRRLLRTVLRLAPHWSGAQESLALHHFACGEWAAGEAVLAGFVAVHGDHARGWSLYACHLDRLGKPRPAADAVLRALSLDRVDREIYLQACAILPLVLPAQAGEVREEMLARFPESWRAWAAAGASLAEVGEAGAACLAARRAVQLQPGLAAAWLEYGGVLARSGQPREAVAALQQAWDLLPRGDGLLLAPPIAFQLAASHRQLGEAESASAWSHRLAAAAADLKDFDLAMAMLWRARALEGTGDVQGARRKYRKALDSHLLGPARAHALQAIEELDRGTPPPAE